MEGAGIGERRLPGDAGAPRAQPRPPPPRPRRTDGRKEEPRPARWSRAACRPPLTAQSPRGPQTWPLHGRPVPLLLQLSSHTARPAPRAAGSARGPSIRFLPDLREDRHIDRPACHPCGGHWKLTLHPLQRQCSAAGDAAAQWAAPAHAHYRPSPHLSVPDRRVHPILTSGGFGRRQCTARADSS